MTFLVSETKRAQSRVIRAGGELDLAVAPQLKELLDRLIEEGERSLVLDLSDATFIDSTTIGALVSASRRVGDNGGALEIVCTNRNVLRTFEYAGLERVFTVHSTVEHALHPAPAIR